MTRTSVWTRTHAAVGVLTAVSAVTMTTGQAEGRAFGVGIAVGMAAVVVVLVVVSLALDVWGGLVAGLAVAVAVTAVRRHEGSWVAPHLAPILVESVGLLLCGGIGGYVGGLLRGNRDVAPVAPLLQAVHGSMGLLGREALMARLDEELSRARRHQRTIALAILDVVARPGLSTAARHAALRTVARVVESRAREHDVPFALGEERLGLLLVEGSAGGAWDVVGDVIGAVGTATFLAGDERRPRRVSEAVTIHAGIAHSGPRRDTADALLDEAVQAAVRSGTSRRLEEES